MMAFLELTHTENTLTEQYYILIIAKTRDAKVLGPQHKHRDGAGETLFLHGMLPVPTAVG